MIRLFFIAVQAFLCINSLWSLNVESASFLNLLRERPTAEDIRKRKTNRIPQHVPEATPEEVALPAFPPAGTIRPSCKREKVGVCLKRRCPSLTLYALKEEEGELREFFGDDWTQVRDLIRSFWEVLLYAVDTGKPCGLEKFFLYPLKIDINHHNSHMLSLVWLIRNKTEFRQVFPVLMNITIKEHLFRKCDQESLSTLKHAFLDNHGRKICHYIKKFPLKKQLLKDNSCAFHLGSFFSHNLKIYFSIKKLPLEKRGRYTYVVVLESIHVTSYDFFNDIGRIRYELKRKGRRDNTGPYPQS